MAAEGLKALKDKLKLGSHHRIERYGLIAGALAVSFTLLVGSTAHSAWQSNRDDLSATALYTPAFATSLSDSAGQVEGVYVSPDETRALLMMSMSPEEVGYSSNAENYEAFITGSTPNLSQQALSTNITGNVATFGDSGYLGVVLTSDEPFDEQIIDITMRNTSAAADTGAGEGAEVEGSMGDETFGEYDQWRLFFNPAATEAEELDALEGRGVDVESIYTEIVLHEEEVVQRAEMDEQLSEMKSQLGLIAELESDLERTNVDGVRIVPPEVPQHIAGDQVTGEIGEVVETPEANAGEGEQVEPDPDAPAGSYPDSTLDLETNWVEPEGFDFQWREGDIHSGYIEEMTPEGETYTTFMDLKEQGFRSGSSEDVPDVDDEDAADPREDEPDFNVSDIEWELTDGTDLTNQDELSSGMEPLTNLMNDLSEAYQNYYNMKVEYQVDMHRDLLQLEIELLNVEAAQSINSNEDAVTSY